VSAANTIANYLIGLDVTSIDYRRELLAVLGAEVVMSTCAERSLDYWLAQARLADACGPER
jgi:hypothetical protein